MKDVKFNVMSCLNTIFKFFETKYNIMRAFDNLVFNFILKSNAIAYSI